MWSALSHINLLPPISKLSSDDRSGLGNVLQGRFSHSLLHNTITHLCLYSCPAIYWAPTTCQAPFQGKISWTKQAHKKKKNCALVELIFWWEETNNKGCEMAPWRKLKHSWTLGHNRGVLVAILNRVVMEGLTEVSFEQELKLTLNYETYMRYVK